MNAIDRSEHDYHKAPEVGLNDVWEDAPPPPLPILKPFRGSRYPDGRPMPTTIWTQTTKHTPPKKSSLIEDCPAPLRAARRVHPTRSLWPAASRTAPSTAGSPTHRNTLPVVGSEHWGCLAFCPGCCSRRQRRLGPSPPEGFNCCNIAEMVFLGTWVLSYGIGKLLSLNGKVRYWAMFIKDAFFSAVVITFTQTAASVEQSHQDW